jgi:predicted nucleic acid-binding protein
VIDLVIDSSIAVKWLVPEPDTSAALSLRGRHRFIAPELLVLECANVFWKKVRRRELTADEALVSAQAVGWSDIEFVSVQSQAEVITKLALDIDHPVYDCAYIALALDRRCQFATADRRLIGAIERGKRRDLDKIVVPFTDLL